MSMGCLESYYQLVPETVMKKVVGAKLLLKYKQALTTLLNTKDVSDSAVNDANDGDFWGLDDELPAWVDYAAVRDELTNEFHRQTNMSICPLYTEGDGDCYDDLDSNQWVWMLAEDDVWIRKLTPEAEEFCKKYGTKKTDAINFDQRFCRYG